MQNFIKNMHACEAAASACKIGVKWPICPSQQQEPLLEVSNVPLLSVMTTLHDQRLYQISSLEANLSLEDMKQLFVDRSHLHTGIHLPMIKTNSEYTFIFLETPVRALCVMLQRLNKPTLLVHSSGTGMLTAC